MTDRLGKTNMEVPVVSATAAVAVFPINKHTHKIQTNHTVVLHGEGGQKVCQGGCDKKVQMT